MNGVVYEGPRYGDMAIEQLRCIKREDPQRAATLVRVREAAGLLRSSDAMCFASMAIAQLALETD